MHHEEYYAPIYVDKALEISFRQCVHASCTHTRGLAVTFHADCARMAARFGNSLTEYRVCTEYTYRPTLKHQKERRALIRIRIEDALCRTYGKLSPELWRIISDDDELIRLYIIAEMALTRRRSQWSVDLEGPVWATYTSIDGTEYVSSMSKLPTPGARQVWDGVPSSEKRPLYVSRDHLGIRAVLTNIAFAEVETNSSYWQTIWVDSEKVSFTGDVGTNHRETPFGHLIYCRDTNSERS